MTLRSSLTRLMGVALLALSSLGTGAAPSLSAAPPSSSFHKAAMQAYAEPKTPLDDNVQPRRAPTNAKTFSVSYAGAGGRKVDGMLYIYSRASEWHPAPAIILLKGVDGPSGEMDKFGFFLAATGYATLVIDETSRFAGRHDAAQTLDSMRATIVDIRRGVDVLRNQIHVNPKRIGGLAFGLGAVAMADAAAVDYRIKALVLVSAGGGLAGILQRSIPGPQPAARDVKLADPALLAPYIAPHPILMINGKADPIVTAESAKALGAAARAGDGGHADIDWVPSAGHVIRLDQVYDYVARPWLEKYL